MSWSNFTMEVNSLAVYVLLFLDCSDQNIILCSEPLFKWNSVNVTGCIRNTFCLQDCFILFASGRLITRYTLHHSSSLALNKQWYDYGWWSRKNMIRLLHETDMTYVKKYQRVWKNIKPSVRTVNPQPRCKSGMVATAAQHLEWEASVYPDTTRSPEWVPVLLQFSFNTSELCITRVC